MAEPRETERVRIPQALALDLAALPDILAELCPDAGATDCRKWASQLDGFARLLYHWSGRMSLVAPADRSAIVTKHLIPAILMRSAIVVRPHATVADLGSGAGLPGVPLQICLPEARFFLIESRRRRASFLRSALRQAGLQQAKVVNQRAEQWDGIPDMGVDLVVTRAVASPADALALAAPLLGARGALLATLDPRAEVIAGVPEPDCVFNWQWRGTRVHAALWEAGISESG